MTTISAPRAPSTHHIYIRAQAVSRTSARSVRSNHCGVPQGFVYVSILHEASLNNNNPPGHMSPFVVRGPRGYYDMNAPTRRRSLVVPSSSKAPTSRKHLAFSKLETAQTPSHRIILYSTLLYCTGQRSRHDGSPKSSELPIVHRGIVTLVEGHRSRSP